MDQQITLDGLVDFFGRPGINKNGFCADAGISRQHIHDIMRGARSLTPQVADKLQPWLKHYGFYEDEPIRKLNEG